jgi:hypothetical protein
MNIYGTVNPFKLVWRMWLTWLWRREIRRAKRRTDIVEKS